MKDQVMVEALNPRHAFHGVRTGSMLPVCIERRSRQKARKFITSLSLPSILWRTSTELISEEITKVSRFERLKTFLNFTDRPKSTFLLLADCLISSYDTEVQEN